MKVLIFIIASISSVAFADYSCKFNLTKNGEVVASYENSLRPRSYYQRVVGFQNMQNYDLVEKVDVKVESGFVVATRNGLVFGVKIDSEKRVKRSKATFTVNRRVDSFSDFAQDYASIHELVARGVNDLAPKNVVSFEQLAEISVAGVGQSGKQIEEYFATAECKSI
ncbi:MAG: hypothetical protein QE271_04045 [Bacteriovoracaceae bacterium]|nr:hypothetical protein [Bacteriovoracaceae bacterium]